jgi:TolB protein
MNAAGGSPRPLTSGSGNDQVPNWSPDGGRLLFYSDRSGVDQLYTMDADGGDVVQRTRTLAANRGASWSPDGRYIFFHSERNGRPSDIYRMPAEGGDAVRLTTSRPEHGLPQVSPDGRTVAFQRRTAGSWRIWLMDPDGANQREIGSRPRPGILLSNSADNTVALMSATPTPSSSHPKELELSQPRLGI